MNNKTTADVVGNVLLVTAEGEDARMVRSEVLHLVSDQAPFNFLVFVRRKVNILLNDCFEDILIH